MTTPAPSPYMTSAEACRYLRVTRSRLVKWFVAKGLLVEFADSDNPRAYRYLRAEVETAWERKRQQQEEAAALARAEAERRNGSGVPADVRRESIRLGLQINDRRWDHKLGRAI